MTAAIALVDGRPVPETLLEDRLARLRRGAGAGLLPAVGTSQFRQLRRWIAQMLIVETLCLEIDVSEPENTELTAAAAADFGSIVAAAYQASPNVRAAYRRMGAVSADPEPETPVSPAPTRQFRLRQALRRDPNEPMPQIRAMGWVSPEDVPDAIGRALADAEPGRLVGPVRSSLGEHVFVVDEVRDRPAAAATVTDESERRREFLDWLARQRRDRATEMPGYEHPADPRQPDHQHRH